MSVVWITLVLFLLVYLCTGKIVNIALNKPVNMSSRLDPKRFPPEKAVDGNTTAVPPGIMHTSPLTESTTPAWWWVDLQTQIQDGNVTIYFRTDKRERRNGVQFYTSTNFSTTPDQPCHNFTGDNIPDDVSVNCTGTWRFLLVYRNKKSNNNDERPVLDFGEVTIYVCSDGTYGLSCTKNCSSRHCAVESRSCDRYTGTCPGGCKPGWMGTDCTQECNAGLYGPDCSKTCNEGCVPEDCDYVNGYCGQCKDGWTGSNCEIKCKRGRYGQGCTKTCGRNCISCHHVSGSCESDCRPGWYGENCTGTCPPGFYGNGCKSKCNKGCKAEKCSTTNGRCGSDCKEGWTGENCIDECVPGRYGENCLFNCSEGCINQTCDRVSGRCEDCLEGWQHHDLNTFRCDKIGDSEDGDEKILSETSTTIPVYVWILILIVVILFFTSVIIFIQRDVICSRCRKSCLLYGKKVVFAKSEGSETHEYDVIHIDESNPPLYENSPADNHEYETVA